MGGGGRAHLLLALENDFLFFCPRILFLAFCLIAPFAYFLLPAVLTPGVFLSSVLLRACRSYLPFMSTHLPSFCLSQPF